MNNQRPHFPLTFVSVSHKGDYGTVMEVIKATVPDIVGELQLDLATRDDNVGTVGFATNGQTFSAEKLKDALTAAGITFAFVNVT